MLNLASTHRFFVSPDGLNGLWLHPLDLSTGMYPRYADWTDATDMGDAEFESFVLSRQTAAKA